MKVIYYSRVWEDGDEPQIEVKDVCDVPTEELNDLLSRVLGTLRSRMQLDTAEATIKRELNLVRPEEAAAISGLKLKSTEMFYSRGYSMGSLKFDELVPEHVLQDFIKANSTCLVAVELPPQLQKQVDAYKKKQEAINRKKDKKKRERDIVKAKKLLEKHGLAIN